MDGQRVDWKPMKWFKRLVVLLALLVAVMGIAPLFISIDDYRPQIERILSERIKESVRLKNLRLAGLPLPHLVIEGVEIGKADVEVGRIAVTPDLLSLLGDIKIIRSVDISGLVINQNAVDRLPLWVATDPRAKPANFTVLVRNISLDDAVLKLQKTTFGPFDARVSIAGNGRPERADVTARDGKFKATIKQAGKQFDIEVQAKDWRPPAGPPIHFDELLVRGMATLDDANLPEVKAKLYGGTVTGQMTMGWHKGLQLKGSYVVSAVELRDLVPLFSPETRLSGRLTAKPVFSASAPSAERLKNALKLETPFDIRDGVLQGIDIQKAASSLLTRDSSGQTRFDMLSGHFAMERGTQRISGLNVASGSLAADGNVSIAPNKTLSGRINAQVKVGGLSAATVPLNISGTLDAPLALPTGAAMAGGAIGTAILPGVGTAIGAKAGNWAEGLFGGGKKK
jgi:uncharacterized protein involved in outer membrane biogenesis